MRPILFLVLLGLVAILWACRDDVRPEHTVINNTDTSLCYYQFQPYEGWCPEIPAHSEKLFAAGCRDRNQQLVIVLTAGLGGPQIYNSRAATCDEWIRSDVRITVKQSSNGFAVEDNLPDATPSPAS